MDRDENGKISLVPKICWNCLRPLNKVLFRELLNEGLSKSDASDKMLLPFCCRIKLMSAPFELEDVLNEYENAVNNPNLEEGVWE